MKISVVVPTYRPQDYFWECLDSLRTQTIADSDFEVIIVLNGCCEPYKSSIEQWISDREVENFRLIQTDKGGVSNARNIALDHAEGEYITFIDDDDFVSPSYLKELYDKASIDVVALCYPLSFTDGTKEYQPYLITQDYIKNEGNSPCEYKKARRFFSGPVYKLIHRDIIGNKRFNTSFQNGEDSIFMFEISDALKYVDFTSKNAIYYRRLRNGSALLRKKKPHEVVVNCFRMIKAYTAILLCHPFRYNYFFYFTRILGAVHGAIEQFQIQKRNYEI